MPNCSLIIMCSEGLQKMSLKSNSYIHRVPKTVWLFVEEMYGNVEKPRIIVIDCD